MFWKFSEGRNRFSWCQAFEQSPAQQKLGTAAALGQGNKGLLTDPNIPAEQSNGIASIACKELWQEGANLFSYHLRPMCKLLIYSFRDIEM